MDIHEYWPRTVNPTEPAAIIHVAGDDSNVVVVVVVAFADE